MITITLTDKEHQTLVAMLEREIPSLREEILHTDDHDYRESLKDRERFIKDLLDKMKENT